MRSGFVTFVGRPNVGKSTLLNVIIGRKVSIVSDKVQTTRRQIRGVHTRPGVQIVFVDTPGIHKPRSLLGERANESASSSIDDVDLACLVLDATKPLGKGDRFVAERVPKRSFVILNKIDAVPRADVLRQLAVAAGLGFAAYFPVSAQTGDGVRELTSALELAMPEGPPMYEDDVFSDQSEIEWVADLVREQLLLRTAEELPHSIACRVTDWEERDRGPYVRVEILVERESQKPMVIGAKGSVLREVGHAVREQLEPGTFLELYVRVDKDWQRKAKALDRLGY